MNSSKLFWRCFKRALVAASLIEGFGAVVFVLGYFVIDGLGPVMEVLQFPSLQVLPFWDESHFGNNPYLWMFAVDLLQFAILFIVSLIAIYSCQRWKFHRPHLGEFAQVDNRSDDNFN
jgi:hypothetical protein